MTPTLFLSRTNLEDQFFDNTENQHPNRADSDYDGLEGYPGAFLSITGPYLDGFCESKIFDQLDLF